jgi:hypothetical protein
MSVTQGLLLSAVSYFLYRGWSQRIDATLHREGEVDARETEETEAGAARAHGGGTGQCSGFGRLSARLDCAEEDGDHVLVVGQVFRISRCV